MNFRNILARRLVMLIPVMVMVALVIALVAVPAGAINQSPAPTGIGEMLNSSGPIPTMINYQGYLTDPGGDPITDTLEMTFSIYDVPTEGVPLWTETHPSVTVTNGLFNVLLGSLNPIDVIHLTGESYLGIQVGADLEMTPRQQIVSVAYAVRAFKANHADTLDGMDSTDFVAVAGDTMTGQLVLPADGLLAGTDQLVLTGGKVGIGTDSLGGYKLSVQGGTDNGIYASGNYGVSGYGDSVGVSGTCLSEGGWGVSGSGGFYGGYFMHSSTQNSGRIGTADEGVYGKHQSTGNYGRLGTPDVGVYGEHGTTGTYGQLGRYDYGVYGFGTSTITGVHGRNEDSGNFGGLGTYNQGVYGKHGSTGNYGTLGTADDGVYGEHSDTGNYGQLGTVNFGVYGKHSNSGNLGVIGSSNEGVYGYSSSGSGLFGLSDSYLGVYGQSNTGTGVYGYTDSGYGVYGYNNSSGNGGRIGTSSEGVYGYHSSSGNYGRLGTGTYGVYGSGITGVYGNSSSGYALYGYSNSGIGVQGYHSDSGNYGRLGASTYGVYGNNTGSGYGVYGYSSGGRGVHGDGGTIGVYGAGGTWDIYAGGAGTNYGPFTGAHEVKFADDFVQDIRPGLIVSVTGEAQLRTDEGEISYSSTLPTVKLSDTPNDKAVFGVITSETPLPEDHWYQAGEGERFGIVNALGEGRVWVTNVNGDIEAGNYITTSAIAGYGQKQDDDFLHSYTLGKAIETIDWSQVTDTIEYDGQTYKIYPIAIVYTSG